MLYYVINELFFSEYSNLLNLYSISFHRSKNLDIFKILS